MKYTKIDKLGRIVIPISYRKELDLSENSNVKISLSDERIIIEASKDVCRLCRKSIDPKASLPLCNDCIKKIRALKN